MRTSILRILILILNRKFEYIQSKSSILKICSVEDKKLVTRLFSTYNAQNKISHELQDLGGVEPPSVRDCWLNSPRRTSPCRDKIHSQEIYAFDEFKELRLRPVNYLKKHVPPIQQRRRLPPQSEQVGSGLSFM